MNEAITPYPNGVYKENFGLVKEINLLASELFF